jgi:hypothetical protein
VSHDGPRIARVLTDGDMLHQTDVAARALWANGGRPQLAVNLDGLGDGDEVVEVVARAASRIGMTVGQVSAEAGSRASFVAGERVRATIARAGHRAAALVWRFVWPPPAEEGAGAGCALARWHVAPTVAYTCGDSDGIHWSDDHFLVEVVDPSTLQAVAPGQPGAVLLTDLTREGSPLLRFWTGLGAALIEEPCPCGRTSARSPSVRPLS